MAAAKRVEYESYSPVFWRVAEDAQAVHEPFLAGSIADEAFFTSLAARSDGRLVGIALTAHELFPPPLATDAVASWLTDDFFVEEPSLWPTVGRALLEATEEAARTAGAERLVVLAARRDEAKGAFLEASRYERGASWWVRPLTPEPGDVAEPTTFRAIVGQAPPVYDPGGPTALSLEVDAATIGAFGEWAAASGAVLGIVPVRRGDVLETALADAGYEPASDWFTKTL
jgi:GNAT superfamily N-acetyltransferase